MVIGDETRWPSERSHCPKRVRIRRPKKEIASIRRKIHCHGMGRSCRYLHNFSAPFSDLRRRAPLPRVEVDPATIGSGDSSNVAFAM